MKKLTIFSILITGVFVLSFSDFSFAQGCVVTGTTPGGGEVVVCDGADNDGITTTDQADEVTVEPGADVFRPDTDVIRTEGGNDFVEINGGMISGPADNGEFCVDLRSGVNELIMRDGTLRCSAGINCFTGSTCKITIEGGTIDAISQDSDGEEAIRTDDGNDEFYISGGTLTATDGVIQAADGDDTIIITGGALKQLDDSDETVAGEEGNDLISVSNANVDGTMTVQGPIQGGNGDDTVRLGTRAIVSGIMYGNSFSADEGIFGEGFDTLVFEMEVREELIDSLCEQVLALDPDVGAIVISGLLYEWRDFDIIECEIRPIVPRPIPTLSQWGMIAMAGVIGIVGVLFVIRRKNLMIRS